MRQKSKQNKFYHFIYLSFVVFILESAIYFARFLYFPPTILAQSKNEAEESIFIEPSPALELSTETTSIKLPILIYHYVEYVKDKRDTIRKSLNIQPQTFEAQINSLKEAGYTFITPSEIIKIERGEEKVEKPIIISFDDGYRDFYTDVFPILKKNNVKAVTYIVPGFLGLKNYMSWDDVKEISKSDLVEIGAHTMHHLSLDSLSDQTASDEINQSKLVLELSLGRQITTFAYPYGRFTGKTVELVKSAGFTSALTTIAGANENVDEKFTLKRIHPGSSVGVDLINRL